MESSTRMPVLHTLDHRLLGRLSAPESVNAHLAPLKVHLGPDQTIQPMAVHLESAAEPVHHPRGLGPPEINDRPSWPGWKVQLPSLGEGPSARGRLDPVGAV